MSRSTRSLALRIAQLLEDFSEAEIHDAVRLLRDHGHGSALLEFFAGRRDSVPTATRHGRKRQAGRPLEETTSRAVLKLRDVDPDKFRILSEFDLMVRRGHLLSTHEAMRRFGERISKNFEPRKARKDTIGALMTVVAARPLPEIEQLIEFAASFGVSGNADEYHRLAEFIIRGKASEV